jgi:hypothetical protein
MKCAQITVEYGQLNEMATAFGAQRDFIVVSAISGRLQN